MTDLIALTGATGFIGQVIARRMTAAGFRLRALVRARAGTEVLQSLGVELVPGQLADQRSLEKLVTGATAVVHCAGAVRGASAEQFDLVNVEGGRRLVQALRTCQPTARLLVLSSLAAREPGLSFYSASKHRLEILLQEQATGMTWLALRPPAVYGPGDRELLPLFRLMAKGIAPVPGSPEARFSMLFVDDLADAVLAWLSTEQPVSGVFALEDGRRGGYNWRDVAAIVSGLCHRPVRLLPIPVGLFNWPARINRLAGRLLGYAPMLTPEKLNELRHTDWVCDSEALSAAIGWRPTTQLEEGLRRTPGWCRRLA